MAEMKLVPVSAFVMLAEQYERDSGQKMKGTDWYENVLAASPQAPGVEPYAGETADLIDQIRQSEGSAVTIMCDNTDFNGQPNSAVEVVADWTNWQTVRFTGDNVIDALRAARVRVGGKIMGDCDSLTRIQIERALTPREEAPAEGAGELIQRFILLASQLDQKAATARFDASQKDATPGGASAITGYLFSAVANEMAAEKIRAIVSDFRARTSEPEAGAVGEVAKIIMFGGTTKEVAWAKGKMPPVGTTLYTLPSSPATADKLREPGK